MHLARALLVLSVLFACAATAAPAPKGAPPPRPTPACPVPVGGAQTGTVQGIVTDAQTGEPLAGVTVILSAPNLPTVETTISDDRGGYALLVPPGTYLVTFYYADLTVERANVPVHAGCATPVMQRLDQSQSRGELIQIQADPPRIDPTSTSQGITITRDYMKNIPLPGRTFVAQLGAMAQPPAAAHDAGSPEAYARIDDHPFVRTDATPLSTFSIDVDTASYANTRRFLLQGTAPPKDAVRIEELVNYFQYDYPAPAGDAPVAITTEVGPSPWNTGYKLVRIGLHSRPIADANVPARNLVFLLDVSGSMDEPNKLPLLQQAMGLLVAQLRPQDRIAIVTYAGESGLALPSTPGDQKPAIRAALAALTPGGGTNGSAGIELAYQVAEQSFLRGGINRVVLCTDGDFNLGVTGDGALTRLIESKRDHGVFLTVLGFGMGNLKDATMEQLADRGNGNYAYIDSLAEARKVLVSQAGATLVTVAKDVKLQVELNPARAAGYRLIGYEDRRLADADFADDKKDAGDLGAGHTVTALYEIIPAGMPVPASPTDARKYTAPLAATPAASTDELMTIALRYKAPDSDHSQRIATVVRDRSVALAATSTDFRWAVAVTGFGMLLHDQPARGTLSWAMVRALATDAVGEDREGYRRELLDLVRRAAAL